MTEHNAVVAVEAVAASARFKRYLVDRGRA
jgi:hypothetical protein